MLTPNIGTLRHVGPLYAMALEPRQTPFEERVSLTMISLKSLPSTSQASQPGEVIHVLPGTVR